MVIATRELSVHFGGKVALDNVSLSVDAGEIVTIVGPNGSGKSTLLRALIGALKPTTGTVMRSADLRIGYVPQRLNIDETLPMTVKRFLHLPRKHTKAALDSALTLAGVAGLEAQQVLSLSGGQMQRVLLARALLEQPSLLLLDEATQGLDQRGSVEFYQHIDHARQTLGCAVIMVSHDLHVVMRRTDRVICLNGHICCEGLPERVSNSPAYKALFGLDEEGMLALYRHHSETTLAATEDSANAG